MDHDQLLIFFFSSLAFFSLDYAATSIRNQQRRDAQQLGHGRNWDTPKGRGVGTSKGEGEGKEKKGLGRSPKEKKGHPIDIL